jgi:hypothetical protein
MSWCAGCHLRTQAYLVSSAQYWGTPPCTAALHCSVKKWLAYAPVLSLFLSLAQSKMAAAGIQGTIDFHQDRRPRNHRCMHQALSLSTRQQHVVQRASRWWCSTCVSVVGQHLTCCYFGFSSILALVLVQSTRQCSFGPSVARINGKRERLIRVLIDLVTN